MLGGLALADFVRDPLSSRNFVFFVCEVNNARFRRFPVGIIFSEGELTSLSRSIAICYRPSVCRLAVTFVHPTQPVKIFGNISTPFGTLDIR